MDQNVITEDPLQAGREAARRHAWREAFDLLSEADAREALSAEDLATMAESAWWIGRNEACIGARERAFAAYLERGDPARAGGMAISLYRDHRVRLESGIARGWLLRAERLLADQPESAEHGWLLRSKSGLAAAEGNLERALEAIREALDIGMRSGDRDLQAVALHDQAEYLVRLGRIDEGLAMADEATVAAVGGELGPWATGIVYCNTISLSDALADYRRAGEWTEASIRWCERQSIAGFPGICRVHRADVIRLLGHWADAEREARQACSELEDAGLLMFAGEGFYEVGMIRLRMGDLESAEDAFRQAHGKGRDPQPGLALLRLYQGKVDAAQSSIHRALDETSDRLNRAKLLPAAVEIAVTAGDLEFARAATDELDKIAEEFRSPALHAEAAMCRGSVEMAEGDAAAACRSLKRSWQLWQEVDAPYEAARARMLLGEAYRARGDEESAALELRAAQAAFERLGAAADLRRVWELIGPGAAEATALRVTRTFMFTDIVRSTNLVEAMGDQGWEDVLRWHDRTLRSLFTEHGGEEIDHAGDGFFVAFGSAEAAAECAVAIQRTLAEHRRSHGFSPQVRIGLHAAEATQLAGDYRGRGVHVAARVGALAGGGEILATGETLAGDSEGLSVCDRRTVTLKGISEPVEVVTVEWE
ncbi:MAG TPA: adenylate/guanylate cyclase domain-containing protein [Actinomycetota bacterium]|nr:adenylate/guanylate cyclase domain-containing protein [Actinomycetota bacterium]